MECCQHGFLIRQTSKREVSPGKSSRMCQHEVTVSKHLYSASRGTLKVKTGVRLIDKFQRSRPLECHAIAEDSGMSDYTYVRLLIG